MFNQASAQEIEHQPTTYKVISNKEWPIIGILAGSSQPGRRKNNSQNIDKPNTLKRERKNSEVDVQDVMLDLSFLYKQGVRVIYNLTEDRAATELSKYFWQTQFKNTTYITDIAEVGIAIEDYHAPTQKQLAAITDDIIKRLTKGENILVHCAAGKGRTGTIFTAVYMKLFKVYDPDIAIKYVRKYYFAAAVETDAQVETLRIFAENLEFN